MKDVGSSIEVTTKFANSIIAYFHWGTSLVAALLSSSEVHGDKVRETRCSEFSHVSSADASIKAGLLIETHLHFWPVSERYES